MLCSKKPEFGKITTYDFSSKESLGSIEYLEIKKYQPKIKTNNCHTCPGMSDGNKEEEAKINKTEIEEKQ